MSTAPVTLLVARRVAAGRYRDFLAWQREGEALAADFPGYLGSG
ncbi:antibiotic biosynthesis monooxygenase, partial [Pseudomonas aeruginosa]|nr:antibiotic biosynthesis monooxygenase [Pseudomonas aeruginosa]MBF3115931.1 antibiotic biosynthesis monooxygenase [Pseudomonas aeruginosa]MBF3327681.1 antibiotic biosynthesis monooxygenase [Pseudomonas aeruginosa]